MPPSPFTQPYQVTEDDRDFLTLAANLKVDYSQLRQVNPYVQSLSQGQHINVPQAAPPTNAMQQHAALVANITQQQQAVQQANMTSLGVGNSVSGLGTQYGSYDPNRGRGANRNNADITNSYRGRGTNANYSTSASPYSVGGGRGVFDAARNYAMQIQNGIAPESVPASMLTALGTSPERMRAAGYVLDAKTGNYVAGNGAAPGAAADPLAGSPGHYYVDETTAPFVGQIITREDGSRRRLLTDKNGRLYYGKIGQNRRGRAKRQAEAAARAAAQIIPSVEAREAPVTALNVIMGS